MSLTSNLEIISGMNKTTCNSDTFPTRLLMSPLHVIIPILQYIGNLCWTTGDLPISFKSPIVKHLIKKQVFTEKCLKFNFNFKPVPKPFLSKVIEKVIYIRMLGHILGNNIVDSFSVCLYGRPHNYVRPLYFVCTMILSQPLEKAMDHVYFFSICPLL